MIANFGTNREKINLNANNEGDKFKSLGEELRLRLWKFDIKKESVDGQLLAFENENKEHNTMVNISICFRCLLC